MTLHPREAILVLVTLAATACSPVWQKPPLQSAGPKFTVAEPLASHVGEVRNLSEEPPKPQTNRESAPPLSPLVERSVSREAQLIAHAADSNDQAPQVLTEVSLPPETRKCKEIQQALDEALEFCTAAQDYWGQGDFENAIASLDEAYNLILQVPANDNSKLIQQKEDIRFMICKRMLEIYTSRHTVANGNHHAIPMVMNRHVQNEIKRYVGPERRFFVNAYRRAGRYRPEILKALEEAGLPEQLSWLPLIESGFRVKAMSRARALGLWQFIPSTGYKFGLRRDQWIDERMDIRKSTRAAVAYLQELHKIFGDWCTVLAAYNCGEARVLKVIRSQNINYLDNFWDLYDKLPWETARYVPRFLAALYIIDDPDQFGLDLKTVAPPLDYDLVTVSTQLRLKDIAKVLDVPANILEDLNQELRYKVTPPSLYELKVPHGHGSTLTAKLNEVPVYTPPRKYYANHVVRRGETLSSLACRYRTTVRALMTANNLRRQDLIRVGQNLKIPMKERGPAYATASESVRHGSSKPFRYRVRRGDSLWLLARRHDSDIREIMSLNNLKSTRLYIGQELVIPRRADDAESQGDTKTYQVRTGDSPYRIAKQHQMKLERFLSLNDLTPRSKIYPGQVLLVDTP